MGVNHAIFHAKMSRNGAFFLVLGGIIVFISSQIVLQQMQGSEFDKVYKSLEALDGDVRKESLLNRQHRGYIEKQIQTSDLNVIVRQLQMQMNRIEFMLSEREKQKGENIQAVALPKVPYVTAEDNVQETTPKENQQPRKKLAIGVAAIKRAEIGVRYLIETLTSIWSFADEHERSEFVVILLLTDPSLEDQIEVKELVMSKFRPAFDQGLFEIYHMDPKSYPPSILEDHCLLERTLGDPLKRVLWRSKQVWDISYLMGLAAGRAEYYLQIEDDTPFIKQRYFTEIMTWTEQNMQGVNGPWYILRFWGSHAADGHRETGGRFGGFIGLLFRTTDLAELIDYMRLHYMRSPIDWLVGEFMEETNRYMYSHQPTLFAHIGVVSSKLGVDDHPNKESLPDSPVLYWEQCDRRKQ